MSHFGHENHARQTDEYGNPIHHTVGGNTGAHVTHAGGEYGTGGNAGVYETQPGGEYGTGGNTGAYGTQSGGEYETGTLGHEIEKKRHGQDGILHRSNSSSSSSSEDDGEGGRRKKSIKEKIKEKLPGKNKIKTEGQDAYAHSHGATTTHQEGHDHGGGYGGATTTHEKYGGHGTDEQPEKKGFMEKIKEKLPGHHNVEGN